MKRKQQMTRILGKQKKWQAVLLISIGAVNIPSRPNLQAIVHWKAALQLISMKNTGSHKNECFDNPLKMDAEERFSKNL